MSDAALSPVSDQKSISARTLTAAAVLIFLVLLIGQWAFFYYIAAFYGTSVLTGNIEVWDRLAAIAGTSPYVAGDSAGNLAYGAHALAAGIIAFGGALQLIPQIRKYAPVFHRWNGRVFLLTVVGLSLSGFYLVWIRKAPPTSITEMSTTFNGILILSFAFLAFRTAVARNITIHRRWALRLYLVSNAQWFLRIGFFAYFAIGTAFGIEPGVNDPFLSFWTFGCYLVPLIILELYLRAKDSARPLWHFTTAGILVALALPMAAGIAVFSIFAMAIISGEPMQLP